MPTYTFTDSVKKLTGAGDATWALTQAGANAFDVSTPDPRVYCQDSGGSYVGVVSYLTFGTASIPDDETVTSVALKLYGTGMSFADSSHELRVYNSPAWSPALWRTPAQLTNLLASYNLGGGWPSGSYITVPQNGGNFASYVNKAGNTTVVLLEKKIVTGVTPVPGDDQANPGWSYATNLPTLEVTTALAPTSMFAMF